MQILKRLGSNNMRVFSDNTDYCMGTGVLLASEVAVPTVALDVVLLEK